LETHSPKGKLMIYSLIHKSKGGKERSEHLISGTGVLVFPEKWKTGPIRKKKITSGPRREKGRTSHGTFLRVAAAKLLLPNANRKIDALIV